MAATRDLQLRVLGPLEAVRGGRVLDLGPPKQRLLLSLLLARVGERLSAGGLTDALWGGRPPRSAPENLRSYVHGLRKALGHELVVAAPGAAPGYRFAIGDTGLDAREFDRAVGAGRRALAAGDLTGARGSLRGGLALWRGPAFDGFADEAPITADAALLEGSRLSACELVLEIDLRLGREAEVVDELAALAARYPDRERVACLLMHALYRTGRQGEALAVYRRARGHLVEHLGVEPCPELRRMEQAVLRGDPALDRPDRDAEITRLRAEIRTLRRERARIGRGRAAAPPPRSRP